MFFEHTGSPRAQKKYLHFCSNFVLLGGWNQKNSLLEDIIRTMAYVKKKYEFYIKLCLFWACQNFYGSLYKELCPEHEHKLNSNRKIYLRVITQTNLKMLF